MLRLYYYRQTVFLVYFCFNFKMNVYFQKWMYGDAKWKDCSWINESFYVNYFFERNLKKRNKFLRSSLSKVICKIGDFKNWKNSQENTRTGASFLIKWPCWRCFSVGFANFLRTPCFTDRLQTSPSDISVALFDCNSQSILLQNNYLKKNLENFRKSNMSLILVAHSFILAKDHSQRKELG